MPHASTCLFPSHKFRITFLKSLKAFLDLALELGFPNCIKPVLDNLRESRNKFYHRPLAAFLYLIDGGKAKSGPCL